MQQVFADVISIGLKSYAMTVYIYRKYDLDGEGMAKTLEKLQSFLSMVDE